jgi:Kdo2-lipid IVA lauroyltransferase/acyltransferase
MMARGVEVKHWLQDQAIRLLIWVLLRLPYALRVRLCGWVMAQVIAPIAGFRARVRDNLALVMPDLPAAEVARLVRAVPDNVGRTIIEIYSGAAFTARVAATPPEGAGLAALDDAHRAGRPVILVTGHFGNYDASRAALIARGFRVGALYRPMKNRFFNAHYVAAISRIGTPLFPRGRAGLSDMVRHLKSGGMLGLVIDQHMAAELALKYDALLVPTYAIRLPDGLNFKIMVEAPITTDTPENMTQALNDSLERIVRAHMDQWFWIHRRWK